MILNWLTDWKFWGFLIEGVGFLLLTYFAWSQRRELAIKTNIESGDSALGKKLTKFDRENHDKIKRVHVRMDGIVDRHNAHGHRITKVESAVGNLPSHSDIGILHKKIGNMQQDIAEAITLSKQTNTLVQTINSFLIQKD